MADFIGETIQSLLDSTVVPETIWVVDDASTDVTAEIASGFDKVHIISNKENQERSVSRNIGIRKTTAPYVQIIDADDRVDRSKIQLQLQYLENHDEADAVYGDKLGFTGSLPLDSKDPETYEYIDDLLMEIIRLNFIVPGMMLFRRSFFDTYGLFDPDIIIAEDRELLIRSFLQGARVEYTPGAVTYYRRHPGSSLSTAYARGIHNNVKMFRKLFEDLVTFKKGAYKQATVDAVRKLARSLNIYQYPIPYVSDVITLAQSTDCNPRMDQHWLYDWLGRLTSDYTLEKLLRPKFKLDHLLGRYS